MNQPIKACNQRRMRAAPLGKQAVVIGSYQDPGFIQRVVSGLRTLPVPADHALCKPACCIGLGHSIVWLPTTQPSAMCALASRRCPAPLSTATTCVECAGGGISSRRSGRTEALGPSSTWWAHASISVGPPMPHTGDLRWPAAENLHGRRRQVELLRCSKTAVQRAPVRSLAVIRHGGGPNIGQTLHSSVLKLLHVLGTTES